MSDSALLASLLLGQKRRADPIEGQRKYGENLIVQSAATTPVQSPLEGLARALQGGVGGFFAGQADQKDEERSKKTIGSLSALLSAKPGPEFDAAVKGVTGDPDTIGPILGEMLKTKMEINAKNQLATGQYGAAGGVVPGQAPPTGAPPQITQTPLASPAVAPPQAQQDAQKKIQYLVNVHGFTPEQASDAVGHLYQESKFDPNAVGDKGTAFGQGQWRLDRQDALRTGASAAGEDPSNPTTQLDFFANEFKTRPEWQQFAGAQNPQQRQDALMVYFRPQGYTPNNPQAGDGYTQRGNYGQQFATPPAGAGNAQQPGAPLTINIGAGPQGSADGSAMPPQAPPQAAPKPQQISPQAAELSRQAQASMQAGDPVRAAALQQKAQEAQAAYAGELDKEQRAQAIKAPGEAFTNAGKLRDDFQQSPIVKSYREVQPIMSSMDEAMRRPTKAADLNLIYGLGKIMDPNSVVREGELALAKSTGTLGDELKSLYAKVNGGAGMTQETRARLVAEARSRFGQLQSQYEAYKGQVGGIASRAGLDPRDVMPEGVNSTGPVASSPNEGVLNEARDAIAKGAPRDKVIERLRAAGVPPEAL